MLRTPLSSPSIKQAIAHAKGFSLAGQPPSSPTTSNFRAQASPLCSPIVPVCPE
ncbi:hypothetical protein BV25DRAFT_1822110 [Artomyces pyxidatus]|uniref:Uncharacterized protein n=1 Tax=Artomyces pyxidatus TaxID=48021 RepID=A0ACB8TAV0_9AGAM|nr:hypothetical protein BV25DRAFT_1822110 [Artomyces pyxidatus]